MKHPMGPYTKQRAMNLAIASAQANGKPYVVSKEKDGGYTVLSFYFHHIHEREYDLTPIVTVFPGATPLPRQIID